MYKFPVTKNGKEYGVSIVKDNMHVAGYRVRLYEKSKFMIFNYNKLLVNELFTYRKNDHLYLEMLEDRMLYKYFTNYVISKYERTHEKEMLLEETIKQFAEWDGML